MSLTHLSIGFHFTVSGASVDTDACGKLEDLSPELQSGVHNSALNVDFRSNRIIRGDDFFLFVVCIPPTAGQGRRKRESLMTDSVKLTNGDTPTATTQTPTEANNYRYDCTPTFSFDQRVVRDYNDSTQSIEKYLVSFHVHGKVYTNIELEWCCQINSIIVI